VAASRRVIHVEVGVYDGTVPTERHPTAEPAPAGSLIDLRRVARR
jgi:hypothetical protein